MGKFKRLCKLSFTISTIVVLVSLVIGFIFELVFGENQVLVDVMLYVIVASGSCVLLVSCIGIAGYLNSTSWWKLLNIFSSVGTAIIFFDLVGLRYESIGEILVLSFVIFSQYAEKFYYNKIEPDDLKKDSDAIKTKKQRLTIWYGRLMYLFYVFHVWCYILNKDFPLYYKFWNAMLLVAVIAFLLAFIISIIGIIDKWFEWDKDNRETFIFTIIFGGAIVFGIIVLIGKFYKSFQIGILTRVMISFIFTLFVAGWYNFVDDKKIEDNDNEEDDTTREEDLKIEDE